MILRQYARLFGSRDESGARRLGTASPLEAAQHGKARLQVAFALRHAARPLAKKDIGGLRRIAHRHAHIARPAGEDRDGRTPWFCRHAAQRGAGTKVSAGSLLPAMAAGRPRGKGLEFIETGRSLPAAAAGRTEVAAG